MALNPNALVTWADTKTRLELEDSDQADAEFFINSISERVENMIGYLIPEDDYTRYLEGYGDDKIVLPEFPVNTVTSLYLDANRVFGSSTGIDASKYHIDLKSGIITLFEDETPVGVGVIKAVYNAGFDTIPADLQQATFETVDWNLGRFRGEGIGVESTSAGGVNVRPALTIPTSAWNVFMLYRRPAV